MNKFILTIISITSLLLINGCGLDQLIDSEQSITRAGNPNPEGEESDTNEETEAEEIPTFDPQDNPQEKPSYTEETPQEKEKIWMNKGWGKCPYLEVEVDTEDKQFHLTTYESPEAEEPCDKTSAPYQTDLDGTLKSSPAKVVPATFCSCSRGGEKGLISISSPMKRTSQMKRRPIPSMKSLTFLILPLIQRKKTWHFQIKWTKRNQRRPNRAKNSTSLAPFSNR
ncbi:MAG: hypothetical protein HYW02_07215 [Deltaproteobacteria bacterium]|nr:hypothetical protein [Deltaproteobacteria bacterium]